MKNLLSLISNSAALIGIVICFVSGIGRIVGSYHIMNFEVMTLFNGGTSLMVFAVLAKLYRIGMDIK
ncbi:MAG: hypothetical protein P4L70_04295 [Parasulfuritortus sp.]|nr:hypothetical protein [Parasulfuritortus sp.]